jgi:hypothetical protein
VYEIQLIPQLHRWKFSFIFFAFASSSVVDEGQGQFGRE